MEPDERVPGRPPSGSERSGLCWPRDSCTTIFFSACLLQTPRPVCTAVSGGRSTQKSGEPQAWFRTGPSGAGFPPGHALQGHRVSRHRAPGGSQGTIRGLQWGFERRPLCLRAPPRGRGGALLSLLSRALLLSPARCLGQLHPRPGASAPHAGLVPVRLAVPSGQGPRCNGTRPSGSALQTQRAFSK